MNSEIFAGGLGIVLIIFYIVLLVLWILLPFAVFGVKKRLDILIDQNTQVIALLRMNMNSTGKNIPPESKERIEPTIKL